MNLSGYLTLLCFILTSACASQDVNRIPDGLVDGMSGVDVLRRIFEAEGNVMHQMRTYSPVVETYMQSLWPDTTAQMPLSDVYFLGKVNFYRYFALEDDAETLLFGTSKSTRQILNDNGQKFELYPEGFLSMLFVDVQDFDADTYRLVYLGPSDLGTIGCFKFSVIPVKKSEPGRFIGTIWVHKTSLGIVRVEGTFQPRHIGRSKRLSPFGTSTKLFLHFDCWRELIKPDLWVPAYLIVDDNISWRSQQLARDGTTDLHYRGLTYVWGYSHLGSFQNQRLASEAETSDSGSVVMGLEKDGLVAPSGTIEQSLNEIIREIVIAGHLNLLKVTCRILATTPLELFHVDNTIVISRGFLEMVPDQSTLAAFLAHELAHVVLEAAAGKDGDHERSVFEKIRAGQFLGLGIKPSTDEEEGKASALTCAILKDSPYATAIAQAAGFVQQLTTMDNQVSNLTTPRFGVGLIVSGRPVHELSSCGSSSPAGPPPLPLQLRGRYLVGISTGELRPAQVR